MAKNTGESEYHVVAVRLRATGAGNLNLVLSDLDQTRTSVLPVLVLAATTRIEPIKLANFQSQRIRLELTTTVINETFRIRRILIFAKPVAQEYPA